MAGEQGSGVFLRQADGEHGAFAAGAFVHEAGAEDDDAGGLLDTEDAGDAGGGDFTHAVADDGGRFDAERLPERGQRDLHGKDGGLSDFRFLEAGRGFVAGQFLEQREPGPWFHGAGAVFEGFAEDRFVAHQFAAHAPPLGALAAHDEADAGRVFRARGEGRAGLSPVGGAGGEGVQLRGEGRRGGRRHCQPVRMMVAARPEGVGQVGQQRRVAVALFVLLNPVGQTPGGGGQGRLRARGKHDRPRAIGIDGLGVGGSRGGRFAEDDVGIGAAEAEGIDADETAAAGFRKRFEAGRHAQLERGEVDGFVRGGEVQARRDLAVLEDEQTFDQADDAGGGFEVADVGFDRPDRQWCVRGAVGAEGFGESGRFDRVADGGAGAVSFDEADLGRLDAGVDTGVTHQLGLGFRAG